MLISVSAKKLAWHGNMTKPVVGAREEAKEGARATEREAGTSFQRTNQEQKEQRAGAVCTDQPIRHSFGGGDDWGGATGHTEQAGAGNDLHIFSGVVLCPTLIVADACACE